MAISVMTTKESVDVSLWQQCLHRLRDVIPQQQFAQWISPLQAEHTPNGVVVFAPNQYVLDGIKQQFLPLIRSVVSDVSGDSGLGVSLMVGATGVSSGVAKSDTRVAAVGEAEEVVEHQCNLNVSFTFDNFVEGKSNQLAKAAALQVGNNPGAAYNPLFLYGGVGLGKTHLMQAVGNLIRERKKDAKVVYLHSERFVADMVRALQGNAINEFKRFYRSVDALLIDDIQFFAGKERSQEEFFHTFNALLEGHQQIILTSDRFPKEIHGIEERLKSRFGSGLTVAVQPPEIGDQGSDFD